MYIGGQKVTPPKNWQDIKVLAAFGTNSNQPEIETDRFILVADAAKIVMDRVKNGYIFEGLLATLEYKQRGNTVTIFTGFIDTSDNYEELDPTFGGGVEKPNSVKVKFKGRNTISNFFDQIDGVTSGFLINTGVITASDFTTIPTVIVKRATFTDVATALVMSYILFKQIRDSVKEIATSAANVVAHLTGGLTGSIASVVFAVALVIIQIIYVVVLIALLVQVIAKLIRLLAPPVVQNKGINFRTYAEKICGNYGLTFVSPIEEMDTYHYLPSKPFTNETNIIFDNLPLLVATKIGTPSTSDFGYFLNEYFEICKRLFDAKMDVIGNFFTHLLQNFNRFGVLNVGFNPII